jgi:kumamolisin
MTLKKHLLVAAGLAALAGVAHATPYPHARSAPAAADLGAVTAEANAPLSVTVALKLSHTDQLESLLESVYTQGSPQYHQFLTPQQFRERFGPDAQAVAAAIQHFQSFGLSVSRSSTSHLRVNGSAAAIARAFGVQLHNFTVAASGDAPAYTYRAPLSAPQLPAQLSATISGVFGLDTQPRFFPHLRAAAKPAAENPAHKSGGLNPFGSLTVQDFAQVYDVTPLYRDGIDGHGRTLAIVTLAAFTPSDAFTYWRSLGLAVRSNRLTQVEIDGGSGPPSDDSGSLETTLDVEQSGGIAPGADIVVYEAPNTNQGFLDAFAAVIETNQAETLSTSWGEWELFDSDFPPPLGNGPVTDPVTGRSTSILHALNDLLLQAALQGQSAFAAAGDAGAYDENGELPPQFSNVLSVDDPGVQPFLTDAGGTTLPGPQPYALPDGSTFVIHVAQERAWGWDYLEPLCKALGQTIAQCEIFPAGGGGGVSLYFPRPFYQAFVPGMADTQPGQALYDNSQTPPELVTRLRAHFPGRNVPDISLNSDPDTGYVVAYTSNSTGFSFQTFWGGTSFASPQMNGVTALLSQGTHGRIGLLNVPLYLLAGTGLGYSGHHPGLRDITAGDNWYWHARAGYDQATGVGVPDVANLLQTLRDLGF